MSDINDILRKAYVESIKDCNRLIVECRKNNDLDQAIRALKQKMTFHEKLDKLEIR